MDTTTPQEKGDSSTALLYVLCAVAAVGVLADVILLVWQLMTYKLEKGFRFVKGSLILLDLFYALTGVAVILLLLHQDVAATFLCKAGGFLVLFTTQETIWVIATCSVALLLWKHKSLSRDFQQRNVSIFALIVGAQGLILLTISFLPFTNIGYFDSVAEYYFRCTPLRLPGEQGWAFSALVLVMDWIALAVSVVTLAVVSVRYSKCTEPEMSPASRLMEAVISKKRLQRQVFLSLCVACGGWITTHVLVSASYFSGGSLDKGTVQWLLGFCISVCLNLHPLTFLVHSLLCRYVFPRYRKDPTGLRTLLNACPRSLDSAQRQQGGPQDPGIVTFLIRWRDRGGCQQTGSMKIFTPPTQEKWRNEVNAVTRVGALSHPNVAPYLWVCPTNAFSAFVQSSTRLSLSKRSLLICRLHYPNGTLCSFLQNRIHQLTEIGLHKITLDVASGLEHIHQHHLVHNGLTTQSIYMASISEKIGLKAVIGDLENCYEVPANTTPGSVPAKLPTAKPWTSGSQLPDLFSITGRIEVGSSMANNRFAPDIRSFGMVVLEMLMALTEYNQKKRPKVKVPSRATSDSRASECSLHAFDALPQRSAMTEIKGSTTTCSSTDPDVEPPAPGQHHQHASGEPCTCSSNVTNIRAIKRGNSNNTSKPNHYGFQLAVLSNQKVQNQAMPTGKLGMSDVASLDSINEVERLEMEMEGEKERENPALADGGFRRAVYVNQVVASSETWRKAKPWEIQHPSQDVSEESICPQSEYSPRSDTSVSSLDTTSGVHRQKEVASKTVCAEVVQKSAPTAVYSATSHSQSYLPQAKYSFSSRDLSDESPTEVECRLYMTGQISPGRSPGSHTKILTNGSLFLTPRSTPEIRAPSRPPKADVCTDTADFTGFDSSESLPGVGLVPLPNGTVDIDNAPVLTEEKAESKQVYSNGFQTIYEEEDGGAKGGNSPQEEQGRKIQKLPISRRRLPPVPNMTEQSPPLTSTSDVSMTKKKRHSMASLDESLVSFDSGVGSSCHYDMSEQSSVYFTNVPGTRQPFYMGNADQTSESQGYGPGSSYGAKRQWTRPQDSGIDSSADSCDELSRSHDGHRLRDISIKNNDKSGSRETTLETDAENVYEVVPDTSGKGLIVKKKKPCIGHHEGVGHSCCSISTSLDTLNRSEHRRTSANYKTKDNFKEGKSTANIRDQSPRKSKQESAADVVNGKLSPSRQHAGKEAGATKANVEAQWKKLVDTATNTSDQDESAVEEEPQKASSTAVAVGSGAAAHEQRTLEKRVGAPLTGPVFTKLEAALLDELLDIRQKNNASRSASAMLGDEQQCGTLHHNLYHLQHHQHHHESCASHCGTCKRIYKRQCEVAGYLQPVTNRRWVPPLGSNCNSSKLSSSSSSPSSLLQHSLSSVENLSSYSEEGGCSSISGTRAGLGYRQVGQMQQLLHPRSLPSTSGGDNQEMRRLLDGVQKTGNLGYIAGQLVPLLSECWTDDPVPTADDILHKLCEVLPTAAV